MIKPPLWLQRKYYKENPDKESPHPKAGAPPGLKEHLTKYIYDGGRAEVFAEVLGTAMCLVTLCFAARSVHWASSDTDAAGEKYYTMTAGGRRDMWQDLDMLAQAIVGLMTTFLAWLTFRRIFKVEQHAENA